jgi:hypothetical protein
VGGIAFGVVVVGEAAVVLEVGDLVGVAAFEEAEGGVGIALGKVAREAYWDLALEWVETDGEPGVGEGGGVVGGEGESEPGLFEAEFPIEGVEVDGAGDLGFDAGWVGGIFGFEPEEAKVAVDSERPEGE